MPRHPLVRAARWLMLAAAILPVAGCLTATAVLCAGPEDIDRRQAVAANLRLLRWIPSFPGSTRIASAAEPINAPAPCGDWYVASYDTVLTYRTPRETSWRELRAHFREALRSFSGRFATSTGAVFTMCVRGVDSSICIEAPRRWNGVYTVRVNSRAYAPVKYPSS